MPMSTAKIGKPERETQNRIVALFRDELNYRFLGKPNTDALPADPTR